MYGFFWKFVAVFNFVLQSFEICKHFYIIFIVKGVINRLKILIIHEKAVKHFVLWVLNRIIGYVQNLQVNIWCLRQGISNYV